MQYDEIYQCLVAVFIKNYVVILRGSQIEKIGTIKNISV
jgi:hypothetical protein